MNRRDCLKSLLALSAAGVQSTLFAAPATEQRLLLVFLRGGYDACNVVIPTSSRFYYESRPNIAIAAPGGDAQSALALNADWGLHPALRESMYPLYQQGELAFMPFAGIDDLSRSHFETQDSIEMGQPLGATRQYQSGFLNRLAEQLNAERAKHQRVKSMSFTDQLPIIFRGSSEVANAALMKAAKTGFDERQSGLIAHMYGDTALKKQVDEGFVVRGEVAQNMQEERLGKMKNDGNRDAISSKGFELEARRIAKMMREQYALGFIDVGGWDTHVNQGGANGVLANKLEELGRGLSAYREEMGAMWKQTTVVVISEFGRTFRENGKRGTDHGHGTAYWILGGSVHGGRVVGEQVAVTQKSLFQDRDFPVLNEYRAVLGGLFARLYGLNGRQMERVFSGVVPRDFGIV